jgi:hypothetical protein
MRTCSIQKAKVKFGTTLYLLTIIVALMLSASASSSFPPFLSPYNLQQAKASTSAESNVIITNMINFTTTETSILYPANWNAVKGTFQSEDMNSIITFRLLPQNDSDNSLAILNIARYNLGDENITTEQYANAQMYFLSETIPDFRVIQFNKTTLAGRPAYQAVYSGLEGTDETMTKKIWVIDDPSSLASTAYTITYNVRPENYFTHLESAREMIDSFVIREKVASAPIDAFFVAELLKHVPEASRDKLLDIASLDLLKSILGGDLTNFIEGSSSILPSNLAEVVTSSNEDPSIYYQLTSAYLNATNDTIYALLVLVFTDNATNRVLAGEPIDYEITIDGANFNFEEHGNTSTGLDIKILNGTSLEQALKSTQQYDLRIDIPNINRTST